MQYGSDSCFGIPVCECGRAALLSPVRNSQYGWSDVDIGEHEPELFTLLQNSIRLLTVTMPFAYSFYGKIVGPS